MKNDSARVQDEVQLVDKEYLECAENSLDLSDQLGDAYVKSYKLANLNRRDIEIRIIDISGTRYKKDNYLCSVQ